MQLFPRLDVKTNQGAHCKLDTVVQGCMPIEQAEINHGQIEKSLSSNDIMLRQTGRYIPTYEPSMPAPIVMPPGTPMYTPQSPIVHKMCPRNKDLCQPEK
jgi:hypothetical protein